MANQLDEYHENLARNLRFFRNERNLSQRELSRKINYAESYVGKIERGQINPSFEVLKRLVDVLEVPLPCLLLPDPLPLFESSEKRVDPFEPLIMENYPFPMGMLDTDGTVLYGNPPLRARVNGSGNSHFCELPFWQYRGLPRSQFRMIIDDFLGEETSNLMLTVSTASETVLELLLLSYFGHDTRDFLFHLFDLRCSSPADFSFPLELESVLETTRW